MRQKSAPSSTAQKFRVGDPVWVIRPRPMGTHRTKTWFTSGEVVCRIDENTYRIKVGHGQFRERQERQIRVREPNVCGQHVSLTTAHMRLIRTTTTLSRTTIPSRRSWPSAQTPRHAEAWSSRFVGGAMGRPTTPRNPSSCLCRGLTPLHGLHPQAQDQAPCLGLGSTLAGDCSQRRLITALGSPL